jgi:catecholate siderophore receptor
MKILLLLLSLALPGYGDPAVRGRVVDPSGAAVAGAKVLAEVNDKTVLAGETDAQGEFQLVVPEGACTLHISADGFADAVTAASNAPVVIQLQIGNHDEIVTIRESANYQTVSTESATKTSTLLINVPQSVSIVDRTLIRDQMMMSIGDVVRYVPGVSAHQGENNRDQVVIRGNSSSADFFVNGVRDDVQYYRDLYNAERVEALKGPNAMIFGRGGGGGIVNRVTKEAGFTPLREIELQGGAFGRKRASADFDHPFNERTAVRLNTMYENSDSFRKYVGLERYGVNPTVTLMPNDRTRVSASYEYLHDGRTADRGIPSFRGLPADVPGSTFFGDPANSRVWADVNAGSAMVEHQFGHVNLRNRTLIGDYDRGYQNYVPGAVNADRTLVAMSAYNNATSRRNLFNQTDATATAVTGIVRHTLLWGAEAGRQTTGNFRNTGFFNDNTASTSAAFANPVIDTPVTWRQGPTDADNRITTNVAATYVQDQVELSRFVQVVAGVRVDRFDLNFRNRRTGESLGRLDKLVSPRAGLILKPAAGVSLYANYSVSYLPSAGDQFSSLTTVTQQVKPEKFTNYEAGLKWDVTRNLSLSSALYRLDRTNTRSTDPNDPARIVQTGSQRTNGFELGLNGSITSKWRIAGGYAHQDAFIMNATAAARAGAKAAQVPLHTFSLWNNYQVLPRLSAGLGVLNRADMFAAVDNSVVLPGYTRADAAVFYSVNEKIRVQANIENLFDQRYFLNADGNNNISPGYPRAIRVGVVARF